MNSEEIRWKYKGYPEELIESIVRYYEDEREYNIQELKRSGFSQEERDIIIKWKPDNIGHVIQLKKDVKLPDSYLEEQKIGKCWNEIYILHRKKELMDKFLGKPNCLINEGTDNKIKKAKKESKLIEIEQS